METMKEQLQPRQPHPLEEELTPLYLLGATLQTADARRRFEGVLGNIVREIKSGMCTVEQGYAYLENFELHLMAEQIKAEASITAGS